MASALSTDAWAEAMLAGEGVLLVEAPPEPDEPEPEPEPPEPEPPELDSPEPAPRDRLPLDPLDPPLCDGVVERWRGRGAACGPG